MLELKFVLKSLAIAVAVVFCMQIKVGSSSLENQAYAWMRTSSIPLFIQEVAAGAVLVTKNGYQAASAFISQNLGNDSAVQKAGRLNLEFKRSPQYYQSHPEQDQ